MFAPYQIIVVVEGGLVQDVFASNPDDVDVIVIDYDNLESDQNEWTPQVFPVGSFEQFHPHDPRVIDLLESEGVRLPSGPRPEDPDTSE
jgi:hypothetical protein